MPDRIVLYVGGAGSRIAVSRSLKCAHSGRAVHRAFRGIGRMCGMDDSGLRVLDDVSAGEWIGPRLGGAFGAVTRTVPSGFPAYARICHPAADSTGAARTWRQVARTTGRQAHALMQWHALVGSANPLDSGLWEGESPELGDLSAPLLAVLCDHLAVYTAAADRCCLGLWDGYGGLEKYGWTSASAARSDGSRSDPAGHRFSAQELSRPRLRLPHREYVVLAGPLSDALRICRWLGNQPHAQSPNLIWPADQAWCVASEIDLDSTLVGGPRRLIDAILQTPELDAWPVQPDDSLAYDADQIDLLRH